MMLNSGRSRLEFLAAAFAFLLIIAASTSWAAEAQADRNSEITDFTLDNGLEVVVIPDHRAPVVTQMIWYKVGAADEEWGKSGVAHFLEHLMFKGTKKHPIGEFSARISEIGGEENAFTSYDYTGFYQQVTPDALETMMSFEADRMRNLVLTDEVIEPERKVVLEERRMRTDNNPEGLLDEELGATLYQNHPYRIPVIGWKREIEQLSRADIMAFYDKHYQPNNAVLIVAGDVDADTVRRLAEKTYGEIPRGPALPPRHRPQEPEQNTKRVVTLREARVTVPQFRRSWVVPSYRSGEPGEAEALDLLAEILGGGVRSRLYQQLVVKQGIAASAGAYYQGTAVDPTSFTVYGAPRGDADIEDVKNAAVAEIARIAEDGVTEEELELAKARFLRSMIFARDSQMGMARIYGSTLATGGTIADVQEWPERIRAVTADEVREAAANYLHEDRSVTGYLLPEKTTTTTTTTTTKEPT